MPTLPSAVLDDDRYRVPASKPGPDGLAWLRAHVARFSNGADHARYRALVEAAIAELTVVPTPGLDPTLALLRAMKLPDDYRETVATAAAAYQPHAPQSAAADRAVDTLVDALGGRDDETAARVSVLLQAHAATAALVDRLRAGDGRPAVPSTRRIDPAGVEVEVDLADAPFGRGRHACPGRELGERLAQAALSG